MVLKLKNAVARINTVSFQDHDRSCVLSILVLVGKTTHTAQIHVSNPRLDDPLYARGEFIEITGDLDTTDLNHEIRYKMKRATPEQISAFKAKATGVMDSAMAGPQTVRILSHNLYTFVPKFNLHIYTTYMKVLELWSVVTWRSHSDTVQSFEHKSMAEILRQIQAIYNIGDTDTAFYCFNNALVKSEFQDLIRKEASKSD